MCLVICLVRIIADFESYPRNHYVTKSLLMFLQPYRRGFSWSCQRFYRAKKPPLDSKVVSDQSNIPSNELLKPGLEGLGLLNHPASPTQPLKIKSSLRKKGVSSASKLDLPPPSYWRSEFLYSPNHVRERICVRNPVTADALAEAFVPSQSNGKVIIEAFPGLSHL